MRADVVKLIGTSFELLVAKVREMRIHSDLR
jgi:hypothetical protein